VRACLDVGLRPRPGMTVEALLPPVAPPGLLPVPPSRVADPARLKKTSDVLHSLATSCGQQTVPPVARVGLVPTRTDTERGLVHPRVALKTVAGSSTEGTSGAADPGLLRGRAGDAALGSGCVRASDAFVPQRFVRVARLYTGGLGRRPRASGSSRARELLPFAGVGHVWWDRHGRSSQRDQRRAASKSPVDTAAVSRREVSERIGLG